MTDKSLLHQPELPAESVWGRVVPGTRWTGDGSIFVILPDSEDDYFMIAAVVEAGPDKGDKVYLRPNDFGRRLTELHDAD